MRLRVLASAGGWIGAPDAHRDPVQPRHLLAAGEDLLAPPDTDRDDGHAELHRQVRGAVEHLADVGSVMARPLREHRRGLTRLERGPDLLHRGAGARRAARHGDPAERGEQLLAEGALEQLLLRHEPDPTAGDERDERRVQVRAVARRHDERADSSGPGPRRGSGSGTAPCSPRTGVRARTRRTSDRSFRRAECSHDLGDDVGHGPARRVEDRRTARPRSAGMPPGPSRPRPWPPSTRAAPPWTPARCAAVSSPSRRRARSSSEAVRIDLHRCVGEDHRSDVAALDHPAAVLVDPGALAGDELGPHRRVRRHRRHRRR